MGVALPWEIGLSRRNNCLRAFLSPARRGRWALVAPGICPASRFLVGAKTQNYWSIFFLKFHHDIPSNMGMCKWLFRDATKIQNGHQMSTPNFFVGAKLKVRNYSIFCYYISHDMEMCRWLSHKNSKNFKGGNYSNSTITFPTMVFHSIITTLSTAF